MSTKSSAGPQWWDERQLLDKCVDEGELLLSAVCEVLLAQAFLIAHGGEDVLLLVLRLLVLTVAGTWSGCWVALTHALAVTFTLGLVFGLHRWRGRGVHLRSITTEVGHIGKSIEDLTKDPVEDLDLIAVADQCGSSESSKLSSGAWLSEQHNLGESGTALRCDRDSRRMQEIAERGRDGRKVDR